MMPRYAFLCLVLTVSVLGGCIGDGGDDDDDATTEATATLDEMGRTITWIDTAGGRAMVHAAAGAIGKVHAAEGSFEVGVPADFWFRDGAKLRPALTETVTVAENESVEFLVSPFREAFEVTIDGTAYPVASPWHENATFVSGKLVHDLSAIQEERFPHRTPGMPNYAASQDYFVQYFRDLGYEIVEKDPYGTTDLPQPEGLPLGWKPGAFANVWAYRPGTTTPDHIVGFGGHYDMVPNTKHAAFDDTSGTVMTMALAKAFSEIETDVGLLFGLWGGEENGLMGSNFFAKTNPDLVAQMDLYVNLDVAAMAWPGPALDPDPILVSSGPDGPVADALETQARHLFATYIPEMPEDKQIYEPVAEGQAVGQGGVNAQSDHTPFMAQGVPVYFPFTGNVSNAFVFIHGPQDTLYNMTWFMGTQGRLDADSTEDPPMSATELATGRKLLMQSFESMMALPLYATLEIDADLWDAPTRGALPV